MRKVHPKTSPQHTHLLHDNFPANKSSTVAQFLTSEKVSVLPHPPNSPYLSPCFYPLSEIEKKQLSGRRYRPRCALGSIVHHFVMSVPKDVFVSKIGLKVWNNLFWLKGNILKVTRQKKKKISTFNSCEKTCHLQSFWTPLVYWCKAYCVFIRLCGFAADWSGSLLLALLLLLFFFFFAIWHQTTSCWFSVEPP